MATKRRTSSQKDKDYQPDMSSDSAESDHDSTNEELEQEGQGMDPLEVEELVALTEKPTAKELGAANILIQQYKNSLLDDFPNSQKSLKQVFSLRNAMEKSKLKNETEEEALTRKAVEIIRPKKRRRNQSPSSSQAKKQKKNQHPLTFQKSLFQFFNYRLLLHLQLQKQQISRRPLSRLTILLKITFKV